MPDTLRKAGVGIKLAVDANMLGGGQDNDLSGGYVERQKLRDLTRQVNKMYRTESRSELLRESVREAVASLPTIIALSAPWNAEYKDDRSLVVAVGDFHYGADINIQGLRGETINRYDHHVFEARMNALLSEIICIAEREEVRDLHIFLVGDLIDGMLRQSQLMRLEFGMVESTIRLSEYLAQWLSELAAYGVVHVYGATGNHSEVRPLKAKNREFEEENLEKIIFWYLEERLRELEHVHIHGEARRLVLASVQDYSFLLLHGDGEKDIGGLARDAVNLYSEPIDFFVCGHLHKEQEFPSGLTSDGNSVIIRTPSICGTDKYAQSRGFGGRPGAVAMIIQRGYGRRCVYPIRLE